MDLTLIFGIFICAGLASVKASQKWSYVGDTGPLKWHELFPHACGGKHQSPIDLKPEQTTYDPDLKDFAIWYDPPKPDSKMYLKNTGHSVQVDLEGDFFVTNGGLQNVYQAVQFHFHWGDKAHRGSEHLVEGQASPLEMHVVSYNKDRFLDISEAVTQPGGLAVLGVLFTLTKEDNPDFDYITRGMKYIRNPEKVAKIELPLFSLRNLLPDNMERYFRYNGSLTTPGCFETVTWTIFDQMQTISFRQMEQFRKLMQYKHKRSEEKSSRHEKRELKDPEAEKEHNAKEVLNELGIRGKDGKFEREVLKEQLLNGKDSASDTLVIMEREARTKTDTAPTEGASHAQHFINNNFRPVQKVNGRIVHRSFKLRDTLTAMANDKAEVVKYEAVQSNDGHGNNSADHQTISLTLLALVLAINAFKSLFLMC